MQMRTYNVSWNAFAENVKSNNKSIILFGAGAIGAVVIPEILSDYNLLSHVKCYIDNDERLWETKIKIKGLTFDIKSPGFLKECDSNTVIMLNISRFTDVLEQLNAMETTQDKECVISPVMLMTNFKSKGGNGIASQSKNMIIPKTIHYMWLGGKPLPTNLQKCIDSWKKYCPDYEIIEWNENNYDISKNNYMKQAYEKKAYGFVPDYARFDIIYNYGGIYLDTDVELKSSLDKLLYQEAYCSVEKWQVINPGGGFGAVKGHPAIKMFMDERENLSFVLPDGSLNKKTCAYYDTLTALKHGYKINGRNQKINGMNIYTYDYFHPYDYMSGTIDMTSDTVSIHHFNGGWLDETMKKANQDTVDNFNKIFASLSMGVEE